MPRKKVQRNKELFKKWQLGLSYREVGKIFGINKVTAFKIIKIMKREIEESTR
jgi:hypothetical protein